MRARLAMSLLAGATALAVFAPPAQAGGPLFTVDGKPVLWASKNVSGGPLHTQTVSVDAQGRRTVYYRVDQGTLGILSNAQARHFVDRIFGEYTDIPTADITFTNAGPILDPRNGAPIDVDATNVGLFLGNTPAFENPIIFDSDGAITGPGGVLGFFGFLQADADNELTEAFVVLNGAAVGPPFGLSPTSFLGVFTHEFGHFAGPLDHAQINGNIALQGAIPFLDLGAKTPDGFSDTAAYDLFTPFTETLFPFVFGAPGDSTLLAQGFEDSGYFIASLDMDTTNALSSLYPTREYRRRRGSIEGQVFIKSGAERIPVQGMNLVARRVDRRPYPPSPTAVAFPTPPALDADGVPSTPPARAATDSLATVSSAVTGVDFGTGGYHIGGLPLGLYQVQLQQILPFATGGSGIGPLGTQVTLPVREEYFALGHTSNDVGHYFPVPVLPGLATPHVDLAVNGLDDSAPKRFKQRVPNFELANPQDLDRLPARVTGQVTETDPAELKVDFGGGFTVGVQNLYRITVPDDRFLFLVLRPTSGAGDLDLYLFTGDAGPIVPFGGAQMVGVSAGGTADEIIGQPIPAGTYLVGISAFAGDVRYTLHLVPGDAPLGP